MTTRPHAFYINEFSITHWHDALGPNCIFWLSQEIRDRIKIKWNGECFTGTVEISGKTYTLSVDRNSLPEAFDNVPLAYLGRDITAAIHRDETFYYLNDIEEIVVVYKEDKLVSYT